MSYKSSFFSPFCLPFGKAAVLTNSRIPLSPALVYKRMPKLAVDGCCEAAANGIRPWTPWIWGILNFRSIRVEDKLAAGNNLLQKRFPVFIGLPQNH